MEEPEKVEKHMSPRTLQDLYANVQQYPYLQKAPVAVGQQSPDRPLHAGFAKHSGAATVTERVADNTTNITFVETIDTLVLSSDPACFETFSFSERFDPSFLLREVVCGGTRQSRVCIVEIVSISFFFPFIFHSWIKIRANHTYKRDCAAGIRFCWLDQTLPASQDPSMDTSCHSQIIGTNF